MLLRNAISAAYVWLKIHQISKSRLKMEQTATAASIPGTTEEYNLDWEWRKNHDAFLEDVEGRSRWVSRQDSKHDGAGDDWDENESEGMLIQTQDKKADHRWAAVHVGGCENVVGERKHTHRVKFNSKDGKELKGRMVYDFKDDL